MFILEPREGFRLISIVLELGFEDSEHLVHGQDGGKVGVELGGGKFVAGIFAEPAFGIEKAVEGFDGAQGTGLGPFGDAGLDQRIEECADVVG